MKRVYFVRHGETQGNIDRTDYGPEMELTEAGKLQAAKIAKRAQGLDFEILFTSDYKRAKETAEVIQTATNCKIESTPLFRENECPLSIRGKNYDTPEFKQYVRERYENFDNPDWRIDAENMFEFRNRVKEALTFLETREEESIMVVTHSFFLRTFTACMLLGDELTAEKWKELTYKLYATNTGVTVFINDYAGWRLLTWNDHAHFAE